MIRTAVIGLGTMGTGMVATLARAGMAVSAYDVSADQRANALPAISAANQVLNALGMPDKGGDVAPRIVDSLADCVADADLVIENVPEKLDLKVEVLHQIDALVSGSCVLASDTSGIPITKLQADVSAPGRVIGMHWSNPPHIIPIIEVVAGAQTSPETVSWMVETVTGLNMLPVLVKKDVPGFVENRILYAIMREAVDLVEKGVIDAESLDTCVSWGIGYKLAVVGPMALLDMAGLDIYQAVGSYLNEDLCARKDVSALIAEKTGRGDLGMKTGGGMFDYTPEQVGELRAARAKKLVAVRRALET
ncbi:3-hydroxyacyl-CoA dehydrogenase family protein [Pelagibius litoralis]|uniref:3-hydroxyacyl-CoA dehydrogenase family protein n=1 Tax=Pelagibius litoralis TaxID=374515 RepID=A0A967EYH9_9PROT|nr:5-formyl-3-hydroxy-2-methylpyridine 4-carboxylate 5-dehydrogenase [Pelagibius litoralis]NIA69752.1 3-hydroxyacyl-CoA dehydrogenase family protein [Pelagibius litoralis]